MANDVFAEEVPALLEPSRFLPLKVTPLMPTFGAEIEDIDLTAPLSDEVRTLLRNAWTAFGVVIFPGQPKLSIDQHLAVASIFGEPDTGSPFVEKATSQVDVITTDGNRPPVTNLWHSDNTTLAEPSIGTMIQIQDGPQVGGNTSWASTVKAYRCLSEPMKRYLDGVTAVHYWNARGHKEPTYLSQARDEAYHLDLLKNIPPRSWPIVRAHPVTGEKALYVNETYTTYIEGVHVYESKAILDFLYSWIRIPEFYVTHHWKANDVAVWDNFQVQHYGLADYKTHRVNQRVTFGLHAADRSTASR